MKKLFLILLFLVLLIINVKAEIVDINLAKNEYSSDETFQAYIKSNINLEEDLGVSSFKLYDPNNINIPIALFFLKLENNYYAIYFDLPSNLNNGDYKLIIKDIKFFENGILKQQDFSKNFSIKSDNIIISVNPAIIKVSDEELVDITLKNKGNQSIAISLSSDEDILLEKTNFVLNKDKIGQFQALIKQGAKERNIFLNYGDKQFKLFIYSSYPDNITINQTQVIMPKDAIKSIENRELINITLDYGETINGQVRYKNFYDQPITDILFNLTGNLKNVIEFNLTKVSTIPPDEIVKQYLWINRKNANSGYYSGSLILQNKDVYNELPIYVTILPKEQIQNLTTPRNQTTLFPNQTNLTMNNITSTETIEKKRSNLWVWVLLIFIVVAGIFVLLIYLRTKGKEQKSFKDFISVFEKKK